jgi:hypothetical protein
MEQRKSHPIADIFPLMTEEETNDLANDILLHGQREPIWIYQGKILDGRNRYNACLLKGVEPRIAEYLGSDPVEFAVSMNLKRRQLDDAQRSIVAARIASLKRGDNQHAPIGGTSQAQAAILLNVSRRGVQRARKLIEQGNPDLVVAVERGELKVSTAATFANSASALEQTKLIEEHGSAAAAAKAMIKAKADRADHRIQKPVDSKRAADRADRVKERCGYLEQVLQRFLALESSGTPSLVANAARHKGPENFRRDIVDRLRRLAAFANETAKLLEKSSASKPDCRAATTVDRPRLDHDA